MGASPPIAKAISAAGRKCRGLWITCNEGSAAVVS